MTRMTGKCLCGAVSCEIAAAKTEVGACHCIRRQAWSGGVSIGLRAAKDEAMLTGEENLTLLRSSDWAERGFCARCGSSLFHPITALGPIQGEFHFGAGTLDDRGDPKMTGEIFIDRKPAAYAFAGERATMTADEVLALVAAPE